MEYDRQKATLYARKWALGRNPAYYSFDKIGGDCTNFISQCVYAGAGKMNYAEYGWFYISLNNRAPAWTSVEIFRNFMVNNKGAGPYGTEAALSEARPGDVIQLSFSGEVFAHSLLVLSAPDILIAAHTDDSLDRPLDSYEYKKARLISILGVRD